ncbi:MAG: hypothetical protein WBC61_00500, partial [Dehalococcoidia bacterium]
PQAAITPTFLPGKGDSLLNNSRRASNFEFIRSLWMITSHKEQESTFLMPFVVSPSVPLRTGPSNHERPLDGLSMVGWVE